MWNVQWASNTNDRGQKVKNIIENYDPDICCITESNETILPNDGYIVDSFFDYGYKIKPGRRKVILYSKKKWINIDQTGSIIMPGGRFVSAVTDTAWGPVQFIGVCIPWKEAHVRTGRKDRQAWQDHLSYINGLKEFLQYNNKYPKIILGDFNQTIPKTRAPKNIYNELITMIGDDFQIVSENILDDNNKLSIDHLLTDIPLKKVDYEIISKVDNDGKNLSDHFGLVFDLI